MSFFTKLANDIFSPVDELGALRAILNGDVQTWGTEVEAALASIVIPGGGGIPGSVNLADFGLVSDYEPASNSGTDNTAALNAAIDAVPYGGTIFVPPGRFRFVSAPDKIEKPCSIIGMGPASTQMVFDDCNGFDIDLPNALDASFVMQGIAMLTTGHATRTGVRLSAPGTAIFNPVPLFVNVVWCGVDQWFNNDGLFLDEWLIGADIDGAYRVTFEHCKNVASARQALIIGFENNTVGYRFNNLSHPVLHNSYAFYYKRGVEHTGQSEGLHCNKSNFVANDVGIWAHTSNPSSAFVIEGCHLANYTCNIDIDRLADTGTPNLNHTIAFNMMLAREGRMPETFRFIRIKAENPRIIGNTFYMSASDFSSVETIGIDIPINGNRELIHGNVFTRIRSPVRKTATTSNTIFANNYIQDNTDTQTYPMIDDGQGGRTVIQFDNRAQSRPAGHQWSHSSNYNLRQRASRWQYYNFDDNTLLAEILATEAAFSVPVHSDNLLYRNEPNSGSITSGWSVASLSLGTVTTGTVTPNAGNRALQHYVNGGAHTLAPGANPGSYILDIENNASAGAVTLSGWSVVRGDPLTTTNGHKFRCFCSIGPIGGSVIAIEALQ